MLKAVRVRWVTWRHLAPALVALGLLVALTLAHAESAHAKRIVGTKGSDRLVGTAKADQIKGRLGADRLKGRGGNDRLLGGRGADRLNAFDGKRDRRVKGGPGRDVCKVDAADLARMRGCEKARVKGGGPNQNCVVVNEPRLRGDPPPAFSDAFFAITITLDAAADGLSGDELPITIDGVCDVPRRLHTEAAQLVGAEGIAIIDPNTRVFDAMGQELQGNAATTALAGADSVTLRAQLERTQQWRQNEKGVAVPTFRTSRADISD